MYFVEVFYKDDKADVSKSAEFLVVLADSAKRYGWALLGGETGYGLPPNRVVFPVSRVMNSYFQYEDNVILKHDAYANHTLSGVELGQVGWVMVEDAKQGLTLVRFYVNKHAEFFWIESHLLEYVPEYKESE